MTFTRRETPGGSVLSGVRSFTGTQRALLGSGFLVNLISFSVYPYLAILLRDRMSLSMGQVGVVLDWPPSCSSPAVCRALLSPSASGSSAAF